MNILFGIITLLITTVIGVCFLLLKKEIYIDSLTKIFNRKYFDKIFDRRIKKSLKYNQEMGLILIDIDDFKHFNDTHGHDVGDLILVEISMLIQRNMRSGCIFTRWGGDEFAIIPGNSSIKNTEMIKDRLLNALENSQKIQELSKKYNKNITMSIGTLNKSNIDLQIEALSKQEKYNTLKKAFFKGADKALYKEKQNR